MFPLSLETNKPEYCKNLNRVFGEKCLAEATSMNEQFALNFELIQDRDWAKLTQFSPYLHSIKGDLSVTPPGCVLYDNRIMITKALNQIVIDSLKLQPIRHVTSSRLSLAPHHTPDATINAQYCPNCVKTLKVLYRIKQTWSPSLNFTNQTKKIDFLGPLTFRDHRDDYQILATVDRLTCFPHAQVYKNCDTQTAAKYLEENCKLHTTSHLLSDTIKGKHKNRGNWKYFAKTETLIFY